MARFGRRQARKPLLLRQSPLPAPISGTSALVAQSATLSAVASIGILKVAATASGYRETSATTNSWTHTTPAGNNRYLIVSLSIFTTGVTATDVTYDGVAMTLLRARSTGSGALRTEVWGLIAPHVGANLSVVATFSATANSAGFAASFTGVHQTSPTEGAADITLFEYGISGGAAIDVTTIANADVVFAAITTEDTAITLGQNSVGNSSGTGGSGSAEYSNQKIPAGSITMSWTNVDEPNNWTAVAIALRPVTATVLYAAAATLLGHSGTLAATATFAPGTKTATAALLGHSATLAATATFAPGTKTATAALLGHSATLSASATFAAGTKTATAALLGHSATLAATATFAAGTKTATAALLGHSATLAAAATFAAGTKTATAALTTTSATFSATATFAAGTKTATAALLGNSATLSASATFAAGTKTATAALLGHSATLAAIATHTKPVYAATATLAATAATLAATATQVTPTYAATASLVANSAVLAATATHTTPVYAGTSTLVTSSATLAAIATFTSGTKTATAALTATSATLTASAIFAAGTKTATAALISSATTLTATAAFTPGTKTATATLSATSATLVATATHTTPSYTATASLTAASATLTATAMMIPPGAVIGTSILVARSSTLTAAATFAAGTKTATASLTATVATLAATATYSSGVETATASLTATPATLAATAAFTTPTRTATATLAAKSATLAAAATYSSGVEIANATLLATKATLTAAATFVTPTYTASSNLTAAKSTLTATASFTTVTFAATASLTAHSATISASATFAAAHFAGTANLLVQAATLSATATYFAPNRTAVASFTVSSASLVASATYTTGPVFGIAVLVASPATLLAYGHVVSPITLPGITENFKRSLEEVLDYFDGTTHTINCQDYLFPEADYAFDIRRLQAPRSRPVIVFTGFTDREEKLYKSCVITDCAVPQPVYELRIDANCLVFIAAATEYEDVTKSKREVDRIYDLLALLFRTETIAFATKNIFNPCLGMLATEQADLEYAVVTGKLYSELRATYQSDGTFAPTKQVTLAGVTETYKRCLFDLLSYYFDGTIHTINCQTRFFPALDIVFDVRRVEFPTARVVMQFTKFSQQGEKRNKSCIIKPACPTRPVYGLTVGSTCQINVFVPLEYEEVTKSKRQVDRIYDLINAVIRCETKALSDMNIFNSHMSNLALERPDLEYAIVGGTLSTDLFVNYTVSPV